MTDTPNPILTQAFELIASDNYECHIPGLQMLGWTSADAGDSYNWYNDKYDWVESTEGVSFNEALNFERCKAVGALSERVRELEARNPLPFREASEKPEAWLIWSNEHKAYWRPSSQGYVYDVDGAGRYALAEAMLICQEANIIMREGKNPTEIVTPSPELIAAWKEGKQ